MSTPLVVSIPHRLGKEEAVRRFKNGITRARSDFSHIITVEKETWVGNRLIVQVRALGQAASATIDIEDDQLRLEVILPWLLATIAGRFVPTLRRQGTLLLEKK